MKKIVIIGAGINGLMLALKCKGRGFNVEIYEKNSRLEPKGASNLEYQIIRPQYTNEFGWGLRVKAALHAWEEVFAQLKSNYFSISGVAAVSFRKGDWADCVLGSIEAQNIELRQMGRDKLRNLMPAFQLDNCLGGVIADFGGIIHARLLMDALRRYLINSDVDIHYEKTVARVENNKIWISGETQPVISDWVVVTSDHANLMPEHFSDVKNFRAYFADIDIQTAAQKALWHFAPSWVDLGGDGNLWGIPRIGEGGCSIRIGAGSMTEIVQVDDKPDLERAECTLKNYYRDIIHDFDEYKFTTIQSQNYSGYTDGHMKLARDGQTLGILADSGHGFKFAAQNAGYVAESFEHETFGMAARRVAGAL